MQNPSSTYPPGPIRRYRGAAKPALPSRRKWPLAPFLYALAVVALLIAWHVPLRVAILRWQGPRLAPVPHDAYRFTALAYDRLGAGGVSVDQFEMHLMALRNAGFNPLTLTQVKGLIRDQRPVPRNGVLITVNHPQADAWNDVTSVLRGMGWNAVAFVATGSMPEGAGPLPSWRALRMGAGERRWEIASSGHAGYQQIPVDAQGTVAPFTTHLKWLEPLNRRETIYEYQSRLLRDHVRSLELMQSGLGVPGTSAFAFPQGDFGQFDEEVRLRNLIRLGIVSRNFSLGFIAGALAGNTVWHDPHRLNRLRVQPVWNGEDLIREIDAAQAREPVLPDRQASGWIWDEGEWSLNMEDQLVLRTTRVGGQALAWVAGGEQWSTAEARLQFKLREGALRCYIRSRPGWPSHVFLEIQDDGLVQLIHQPLNAAPTVLAATLVDFDLTETHTLRVAYRDQLASFHLNESRLFGRPVRLPVEASKGTIGVASVPSPGFPSSQLTLKGLEINTLPTRLARWDEDAVSVAGSVRAISSEGIRFAALSPPWEGADHENVTLYAKLARLNDAVYVPHIQLSSATDPFVELPPTDWAQSVADASCDGFFIRLTGHTAMRMGDLTAWLQEAQDVLHSAGKQLWVRLPPVMEDLATLQALVGYLPTLQLVTSVDAVPDWPAAAPPLVREERVVAQTAEWPLFLNLRADPELDAFVRSGEQIQLLNQKAEEAWSASNFEKAIVHYSDWMTLEPNNPYPLNRIGDALLYLNFRDEAVDFFEQSLDVDPSQWLLVGRLAEVLDGLGREEEARLWLNRYGVLFPEEPGILVMQAEWLLRRNRLQEARERVAFVLRRAPHHFEAAILMLRLAETQDERRQAVRALLDHARTPEEDYRLAVATRDYDLLVLPDTEPLFALLNQVVLDHPDPRLRQVVADMQPRREPVHTHFAERQAQEQWRIDGASFEPTETDSAVRALPGRYEFTLRLAGSHRWQDADIEVEVKDWEGGLWIHARRSATHFVRLGFTDEFDRLFIQVWEQQRQQMVMTRSEFVTWTVPDKTFTLRLVVRGRGAMAYVDGEPLFESPVGIPAEVGLGHITIDGAARETGRAKLTLGAVTAQPLPARVAWLKADTTAETGLQIERVREHLDTVSDFSPTWFEVENGNWRSDLPEDPQVLRVFARFHELRFMPIALVDDWSSVTMRDIRALITMHDLDGLILMGTEEPDENQREIWRQQPDAGNVHAVFMPRDVEGGINRLWATGVLRSWLHGVDEFVDFHEMPWSSLTRLIDLVPSDHVLISFFDEDDKTSAP